MMQSTKTLMRLTAIISLSLSLTACLEQGIVLNKPGGFNVPNTVAKPKLSRIELRVNQLTELAPGESFQLEVFAYDENGERIDPSTLNLEWISKDGTKVSVDQKGRVTGLTPASLADITVTDRDSKLSDSGLVKVSEPKSAVLDRLYFTLPNQSIAAKDGKVTYTLVALDTEGKPMDLASLGKLLWSVSDSMRFQIDQSGVVTALMDASSSSVASEVARVIALHEASGKKAEGTVDMIRGTIPSSPSPTPSPAAILKTLKIVPDIRYLSGKGATAGYLVEAVDTNDQPMDPSTLNLVWSTDKPSYFALNCQGKECIIKATQSSGSGEIKVTEPSSGIFSTAKAKIRSSDGGGGGGPAPLVSFMTEPVVDNSNYTYAGSTEGNNGRLYAFDDEGNQVWNFQADGAISRNPAAAPDPFRIFFGSTAGTLYALEPTEGSDTDPEGAAWSVSVNDDNEAITTAPLVLENFNETFNDTTYQHAVVVGDAQGRLHAFDYDDGTRIPFFDQDFEDISDQALLSSPVHTTWSDNSVFLIGTQDNDLCRINMEDGTADCNLIDAFNGGLPDSAEDPSFVADAVFSGEDEVIIGSTEGNLYFLDINEFDSTAEGISVFDMKDLLDDESASIRNPVTAFDEFVFVPVGANLALFDRPDGIDFRDNQTICESGSRIVGSPVITGTSNDPIAHVSCNDGNLYHVEYDFSDGLDVTVTSDPINGAGSGLRAGPAVSRCGDTNLLIGGSVGQMELFPIDVGLLHPDRRDWTKFRYDFLNSGDFQQNNPEGGCPD